VIRLRLWLSQFFCPHGFIVTKAQEASHPVTFKLDIDAGAALATLATLEASLERVKALTPTDGLVPPGFHLHANPQPKRRAVTA
jgi:hypothetical protein